MPYSIDHFSLNLINKLAPNIDHVAHWVEELRAKNPGFSDEAMANFISRRVTHTCALQGSALGLPGAVPGLGTVTQTLLTGGVVSADLALLIRNQTYLVFALGCLYGVKNRQILIQDTIICIGLWTNALTLGKRGAVMLGSKVVNANFKKHVPAQLLKQINKKVGTTLLTKYGIKRGGLALGRLIPFGVGLAVGGGVNYFVMRQFASHCRTYLSPKISYR
ncbi:MAG: hypothetical protein M3511_15025 [Deinococcota bacterium]|jgi:hypothetical protein|nr:hypothetical protein [Deinococcota bacterium]